MNAVIRLLYAALIAAAVVIFIGVGLSAAYPGPTMPAYPPASFAKDPSTDTEYQKQQAAFDKSYKEYQEQEKAHKKKLSTILIPLAIIVTVGGLWYFKRSEVIGEGIALGGVATSIYAVTLALMADHRILRFAAVTALLVTAILVVRSRFNEPTVKTKRKRA